ncbi:MAG: hypothetical protein ACLFRG_23055 [Desulfococcaceae bacterium]
MSSVLPRLVPDTVYLRAFLPWQAVVQTRRFLRGELDVIPDPKLGWRNRPRHVYQNIRYDEYGSRSAGGIFPEKRKPVRVVFIGDSRTNGYTFVSNAETISAGMENGRVETLNLATAFYGLDQMVLALESAVSNFEPDVAVIGIGSDDHLLLDSHYIPLLNPNEYGMPFLKPRFQPSENGDVEPVTPNPRSMLTGLPVNPDLLPFLAENDPHFQRFREFQRWQTTPLIGLLTHSGSKMAEIFGWRNLGSNGKNPEAMVAQEKMYRELIRRVRAIGAENGTAVGFVLFPSLDEFLEKKTEDFDRVAGILRSERLPFVDARSLLKRYRGNENLFGDDLHFTAAANRVMADALSRTLLHTRDDQPVIAR